ncbi:hypothetical protein [Microbulbifer sp. PAAF003]|uniref:hypothetical protein n=1 Tax=Microbulbifer sp. PAAF003 TaxID=3243375 RepID=UPI004039207B
MNKLSLIAPYAVIVSVLYLLGYWSVFRINIFEYVNLTDILKVSIYQLAYYGSFFVISGLIFHFYTGEILEPGAGAGTSKGKFFNKHKKIIFSIVLILALYIALFTSHPTRWFLSTCILTPFIGAFASRVTILDHVITNHSFRTMIVTFIIQIPIFAFGWGNLSGVSAKTSESKTVIINQGKSYQNLGVAGSYIFLWDKNSSEVLIKSLSEIKELKYKLSGQESFWGQLTKSNEANKSSNTNNDKAAAGS